MLLHIRSACSFVHFLLERCTLFLPSSSQFGRLQPNSLSLSFPFRHRETRADPLDEFQLHFQVLQRGPGVKRGRQGGGAFQRRHHAQRLPQTQPPELIGDNHDDMEMGGKRNGKGLEKEAG